MAAKESYFAKHKAKLRDAGGDQNAFSKMVQATDEQRKQFEEGIVLLIDKPLHWTSFDVVRKIRNSIRIKKVGHAGTLDPLATGLLIVCTGKFTKKINEFMAAKKTYTGSFTLGATTATFDLESTPENIKVVPALPKDALQDACLKFIGTIEQLPPIYSAIKKDGVALYELARRGVDVALKARPITIESFEITEVYLPVVHFKVVCSTGTYIRSLANDYGAVLGCGAYLSALRRTMIGNYHVDDAQNMLQFLNRLDGEVKMDN